LYLGQIRALEELIPWDILNRPHYPVKAKMPMASILAAKIESMCMSHYLSDPQRWEKPVQIAFFEQSRPGKVIREAHYWAYLESDNTFKVNLPDGIFLIAVGLDEYPILESNPNVLHRLVVEKGHFFFELNAFDRDAPWKLFKRLFPKR
jgi:hypothetical protein